MTDRIEQAARELYERRLAVSGGHTPGLRSECILDAQALATAGLLSAPTRPSREAIAKRLFATRVTDNAAEALDREGLLADPDETQQRTEGTAHVIADLHAERDRLRARLTAVEALHVSDGSWCEECETSYPCPTARALAEEEDQRGGGDR